jgi:hypothetical protein
VRKPLSALLLVLGAFFIVLAVLLRFYAGNALLKTPLDVDSTTHLDGTAALSGDAPFPVKATSITRTDSEKSDGTVVVWENSSCLVKDEGDPPNCVPADDPQERLISASTDKFATDRKTGMAVQDTKYVSADAGEHKGLMNKFPFETEKQTYPYWDGTAGKALNAVYKGTTKVNGLETYRFTVEANDVPIEIADGVDGTYSTLKTIYVEPLTGAIVDQKEVQSRTTTDGDPVLALKLGFTDAQIKTSVDDANANVDKLNLLRNTLPLISLILGLLTLIPGIILWRRNQATPEPVHKTTPEPVHRTT